MGLRCFLLSKDIQKQECVYLLMAAKSIIGLPQHLNDMEKNKYSIKKEPLL